MSLPAGSITDKVGVKKTIVFSQIVTGIFVALLGLIGNYLTAVFLTFIVGLGYGMANPPTTKGIMVLVEEKNRGLAMSAKQTGVPIGAGLAAAVLPPLALFFSWKFSFVVAGAFISLSGLLSQVLYQPREKHSRSLNSDYPVTSQQEWRKIYRNKNIILLSVAGSFCALVQSSSLTYTILYLRDAKNFELLQAAFCLTLMNIGGILGRVFWGMMSDRLFNGSRKITLQLLVSLIFLTTLILGLDVTLPNILLVGILFILGASAIGWNGVYHALIGEISGKEMAGRATGLTMAIVFIGAVVGPLLFGKIVDVHQSYNLAWLFLCGAMVGAFAVYSLIREKKAIDFPGEESRRL
jgi:sugar phosphate permease